MTQATGDAVRRLIECRHHDPFELLGAHPGRDGTVHVRALLPGARAACIVETGATLEPVAGTALHEWHGDRDGLPAHYHLSWIDERGAEQVRREPYTFGPQLPDDEIARFSSGTHDRAWTLLGARPWTADRIDGALFSTWAPNAERVSVVGDFNDWDGRRHPMRVRGASGVWELFVPGLGPGALYKFEIRCRAGGTVTLKSDPYARAFELRPATAARLSAPLGAWSDDDWMARRATRDWLHEPMSIYEVHLGSWRRGPGGGFLDYDTLADELVEHAGALGFTHVELLPVTEHPLDASWGYQTTGFFAPTSRFGEPDALRRFVEKLHRAGIGVILDWVPGHFPRDAHALARFDGSALYEHEDPRRGEHRDWGTLIFNYARNEVRCFLLSSACYWLEEFHFDGLRVDAVASMLYLDYSREPHDWVPNVHGGRENLEAVEFLKELNRLVHARYPGALVVAEESTAWPRVSRPIWDGGLGFSMKWNMGWMHDTLEYMRRDPVHRRHHHDSLTFGMLYAYSENFVLPLSHDEVVHGKGSLLAKMPGDEWQRLANLRLLYLLMYTYPGKKLLFMGAELAARHEWNHAGEIDWSLAATPGHDAVGRLLGDLNRLYRERPELHELDFEPGGFEWIDCEDRAQSVVSYLRRMRDGRFVAVALNFTPVPREGYRLGVPHAGRYREIVNSDAAWYGGSNLGNLGAVAAEPRAAMGRPASIALTLPPLAGVVLAPEDTPPQP